LWPGGPPPWPGGAGFVEDGAVAGVVADVVTVTVAVGVVVLVLRVGVVREAEVELVDRGCAVERDV
jgi:hypothetical protein